LCSGSGRQGWPAATAPREQPGLDDEFHSPGGRVDRNHPQLRIVRGRPNDEDDAAEDGHAVGEQQRPLVTELRTAAQDDDELRRTGDEGPDAEDHEHIRLAPGRGDAESDGGNGAEGGVGQQQLPR
jgi:hypothetical protein